jgi:hypothetical protein
VIVALLNGEREERTPLTRYDALTADGLSELRRARDDFLSGGLYGEDPPDLPAELLAAWRRALFNGVTPDLSSVPRIEGNAHRSLLAAAAPVLERLDQGLSTAGLAIVLSDARGRVEHVQAQSADVRRHLERIDTGPGADLSETATGLNGISAVVEQGRPALIRGPQHILGLYQETACAGAPIRDPVDRRIRGVLSLVCGLDVPPVLLSTLADTAAAAIERELLHSTEARERVLLDAYLPERARTPGVLALDGRTRVVSDSAASILVGSDLALLEELAAAAVRADRLGAADLLLPGSGRRAYLREVLHGGAVAGVLVTLGPSDSLSTRPPRRAPQRQHRPPGLPGLVGSSAAWQALLRRIGEIPAGTALALTGEWGAGRGATALALGAGRGMPTIQFDATPLVADPAASWLPDLAGALERGNTVVIRDADTIPARSAAAVRALLGRRPGGWVLLTGAIDDGGAPWHQNLVPDGRYEVVEVPPLRDRTDDLPELVDALATAHLPDGAGLRLALDADAAVRRWSWPGNVAELRCLVAELCARVGAERTVTSADLPEEMRRVRRAFTGLEHAERTAIRTALRAHAGNRSRAAAALGVGRTTLYRKLRLYGLEEA